MTRPTTRTWWRCLASGLPPALRVECAARGVYEQALSGGDAEKHTTTTGHGTTTTIDPQRGQQWLEATP